MLRQRSWLRDRGVLRHWLWPAQPELLQTGKGSESLTTPTKPQGRRDELNELVSLIAEIVLVVVENRAFDADHVPLPKPTALDGRDSTPRGP